MRPIPLQSEDYGALGEALAAAGLPVADLRQSGRRFFRFEDNDGPVGYGGFEGGGVDRLLRSVVILPDRRGVGRGAMIVSALERQAVEDGARALYVLTTTAERFFHRLGYQRIDRASAPASIAASTEFNSLCPASAAFLMKPFGN